MAGDDGAILAVGMMACFFSAVMSVGLSYTCTGGSFDPDDFDTDKCLELFPEDTSGGGGGGGGGGTNYPTSNTASELVCSGLFSDSLTTCYSPGGGNAGLRWKWIDTDEAIACKSNVENYSVTVSSSKDNHQAHFTFPLLPGGENNSFNFNNAPSDWLSGQNVKFYVSALNASGQSMGPELMTTLDVNNSSEQCNAHGTPVNMNTASLVQIKDPTGGAAGPPPATDCVGGTWSDWGPCMSNGRTLDPAADCGQQGSRTKTLSGYTPATHGGTCNVSDSEMCHMPACTAPSLDIQDCVMEEQWTSIVGTTTSGETLYDDPVTGAKTCSAKCSTTNFSPGGTYPGGKPGGGKRGETRGVDIPRGRDGGASCGSTFRDFDCNTHDCPRDCVGTWVSDPTRSTLSAEQYVNAGYGNAPGCFKSQYYPEVYLISKTRLGTGAACSNNHNDKIWRGGGGEVCFGGR